MQGRPIDNCEHNKAESDPRGDDSHHQRGSSIRARLALRLGLHVSPAQRPPHGSAVHRLSGRHHYRERFCCLRRPCARPGAGTTEAGLFHGSLAQRTPLPGDRAGAEVPRLTEAAIGYLWVSTDIGACSPFKVARILERGPPGAYQYFSSAHRAVCRSPASSFLLGHSPDAEAGWVPVCFVSRSRAFRSRILARQEKSYRRFGRCCFGVGSPTRKMTIVSVVLVRRRTCFTVQR